MKHLKLFVLIVLLLSFGACSNNSKGNDSNVTLSIIFEGENFVVTMDEILAYDKVDFQANVKSSGNDPVLTDFGGVFLNDILQSLDIQLEDHTVTFKANDGYQTMVTAQEVLQQDNVYLVYEREFNRTLSQDEGGTGPLEIVIVQDAFSQRWNKFVVEIIIE